MLFIPKKNRKLRICINYKQLNSIIKKDVMDLIYRAVQVLRENLYWIRISTQDAGLMEPVELWDKG